MFSLTGNDILAIVLAASFAAGLNVYATIATLGLLSHAHAFTLPPALHLLESWPVIIVCALLFGLEFVADKIPVFDLIWNALNTFVKVPTAALLAYGATQHLSPGMQAAATALGGAIALLVHGSKIAVRTAVTPTPEPFSNIALSLGEDVAAISLTWLATQHPIIAGTIAAVCLLLCVLAIRYVIRALRRMFHQVESFFAGTGSRTA
ncbi:MAG TPA: DUF4126 domain-containing protein [Candidatus Angelobacter sp.]|jgi:hypothetical protein